MRATWNVHSQLTGVRVICDVDQATARSECDRLNLQAALHEGVRTVYEVLADRVIDQAAYADQLTERLDEVQEQITDAAGGEDTTPMEGEVAALQAQIEQLQATSGPDDA